MNKRTNEWMGMDNWVDEWMGMHREWVEGCASKRMDERLDEWMNECMEGARLSKIAVTKRALPPRYRKIVLR